MGHRGRTSSHRPRRTSICLKIIAKNKTDNRNPAYVSLGCSDSLNFVFALRITWPRFAGSTRLSISKPSFHPQIGRFRGFYSIIIGSRWSQAISLRSPDCASPKHPMYFLMQIDSFNWRDSQNESRAWPAIILTNLRKR